MKPWQNKQWVLPAQNDAAFVCAMEDVLELYHEPYDPQRPLVCFDESNKLLRGETRQPLPLKPGEVARHDYEYERNGTCNLFLFFAPLDGWRHIEVADQRTKLEFADCMRLLVDELFPDSQQIRVVLDNLNTHTPAALYEAFAPAEARRILERVEFHYTPKHGSWLNMAEIELSVLMRQSLDRRIPDKATVVQQATAWQDRRNASGATVHWRFTTDDARIKLAKLYPSFGD